MGRFFLGQCVYGTQQNLDRLKQYLMLNPRWLFANLLQSPRSAGWFFWATHFYFIVRRRIKRFRKVRYQQWLYYKYIQITFDLGAISSPGVLNNCGVNYRSVSNGGPFRFTRKPRRRAVPCRICLPGDRSTFLKCCPISNRQRMICNCPSAIGK